MDPQQSDLPKPFPVRSPDPLVPLARSRSENSGESGQVAAAAALNLERFSVVWGRAWLRLVDDRGDTLRRAGAQQRLRWRRAQVCVVAAAPG